MYNHSGLLRRQFLGAARAPLLRAQETRPASDRGVGAYPGVLYDEKIDKSRIPPREQPY